MADVSTESAIGVPAGNPGLLEDNDLIAMATAGDDVDFDLGSAEATDYPDLTTGEGMDEIGYEEEDPTAAAGDGHSPIGEVTGTNAGGTKEADDLVDEIDYEDTGLATSNDGDDGNHVNDSEQQHEEEYQQQKLEKAHDEIDFEFEVHEGETMEPEGEDRDGNAALEEDGSQQPDSADSGAHFEEEEGEGREEEGEEGGGEEEAELNNEIEDGGEDDGDDNMEKEEGPEEADMHMHPELDHDESEAASQAYKGTENDQENEAEEAEDDEADSPTGSLNAGFGHLENLYSASPFDVTVTWGDQVCPLFKAPDVDDPDMFYLEDAEALNYPLAKFLQTIRGSISSWVNSGDEIFIRVDDLGLEFGETTTEALLNQVTFHNLLALHSTLSKNDDSTEPKGVHITLGTRPNCLYRLRDLVTGAGSGKGLSVFQKQALSDMDDSSEDSGDNEAASSNLSPDVEEAQDNNGASLDDDDILVPENESGDTEMTGALSDTAAGGVETSAEGGEENYENADEGEGEEVDALGSDYQGVGHEAPAEEEQLAVAEEEIDFMAFTNDEGDDATPSAILGAPGVSDEAAPPQVEYGDEPGLGVDNLLDDVSAVAGNVDHHPDDLDVWGDFDHTTDAVGQSQGEDQEELALLGSENGVGTTDHIAQQGSLHEDVLGLGGDNGDASGIPTKEAALQPSEDKETADDLDIALDRSATATLDHDEIDYEDGHTDTGAAEPEKGSILDPVTDEIDWDDEIKNLAPNAATPTPQSTTGKRSREADEIGDALLDDSPDPKRQRAGDSSI